MSIFSLSHSFFFILKSDFVVPVLANVNKNNRKNHVLGATTSLLNLESFSDMLFICDLCLIITRANSPLHYLYNSLLLNYYYILSYIFSFIHRIGILHQFLVLLIIKYNIIVIRLFYKYNILETECKWGHFFAIPSLVSTLKYRYVFV